MPRSWPNPSHDTALALQYVCTESTIKAQLCFICLRMVTQSQTVYSVMGEDNLGISVGRGLVARICDITNTNTFHSSKDTDRADVPSKINVIINMCIHLSCLLFSCQVTSFTPPTNCSLVGIERKETTSQSCLQSPRIHAIRPKLTHPLSLAQLL